jgi:hypothetical protein
MDSGAGGVESADAARVGADDIAEVVESAFAPGCDQGTCATLFVGIVAQPGGFFIRMVVGKPNQASIGNSMTVIGAVLLTLAMRYWDMG